MRDARVPVLVAACLLPLVVHAVGKPAEGPQSAVEFFQQLFGDAPPEPPRSGNPSVGPGEQEAASGEAPGETAEAPEPVREPVPFDAEEETDEGSDEDIPAVNPAFRGRFGESAEPAFPAPARPGVSAPAPPRPDASTAKAAPVVAPDAVPPVKPLSSPVNPVAVPATPVASPFYPAASPLKPVAPTVRRPVSPAPSSSAQAGDTYVDEEDLMEDEATLEIEDINLD